MIFKKVMLIQKETVNKRKNVPKFSHKGEPIFLVDCLYGQKLIDYLRYNRIVVHGVLDDLSYD